MTSDLFAFKDSRSYLLSVFGDKSRRKGMKTLAAQAIGCHVSVISQVLHGKVQINLEQSEKMSRFLNLNDEESHFFLLLVQKDRAGTRSLQSYFQRQIAQVLANRLVIKKRIGPTGSVSKEDEQKYYSSWHFAAIHVALSVPELRTADALSRRFRIPPSLTHEALKFLVNCGLAVESKGQFMIGPKHIHLGANSAQISNHHRNWRLKTLSSLEAGDQQDLHYSSAITLSNDDSLLIRDKLIEQLKDLNKVIQPSKEEDVYVMNFDFFRL